MAGLYLHIPYCRKACLYCDFHFSTQLDTKSNLVDALIKEIELRKDYANNEEIKTIYFGGGTPSVLSDEELKRILDTIRNTHSVIENAEVTLEANPDDLTEEKVKALKALGINRLSIGLQSFYDEELQWMNRSHNAEQSIQSVKLAQANGIENITIDLIYGSKFQTLETWKKNLEQAFLLNVPHISAYNLTIEEKTVLGKLNARGKEPDINDSFSKDCFDLLINETKANGFTHYEISNFAKGDKLSQHNSSYWKGEKYIGIGPSAHSFNGITRQWNVSNNNVYINSLKENKIPFTEENLSLEEKYNEYILTGLRTMWGVNSDRILDLFGEDLHHYFLSEIQNYLAKEIEIQNKNTYVLTNIGKHLADRISSDLFYVKM